MAATRPSLREARANRFRGEILRYPRVNHPPGYRRTSSSSPCEIALLSR
jgi:hypothetical protein